MFVFEDRVLSDILVERKEFEGSIELVMKDAKTGFGSRAVIPKTFMCRDICEDTVSDLLKVFDGVAKSLLEQKLKSLPEPKVMWLPPRDPSFLNVLKYPLPLATVGKLCESFRVWLGKPLFSFMDPKSPSVMCLGVFKDMMLFKLEGKKICELHKHLLERLLKVLPESRLAKSPYVFMDRLYGNDFIIMINKNVKKLSVPTTLKNCLERDEVDFLRPTSLLVNMLLQDMYPSFVTEIRVDKEVEVLFDDGKRVKAKIKDSEVIIYGDVEGKVKLINEEGYFEYILEEELGLAGMRCRAEAKIKEGGLEDLWKASIAFWSAIKLFGREMVLERCSLGEEHMH